MAEVFGDRNFSSFHWVFHETRIFFHQTSGPPWTHLRCGKPLFCKQTTDRCELNSHKIFSSCPRPHHLFKHMWIVSCIVTPHAICVIQCPILYSQPLKTTPISLPHSTIHTWMNNTEIYSTLCKHQTFMYKKIFEEVEVTKSNFFIIFFEIWED